jgi:cell wall-associated NlpC family hydrolase
MGRQTGIPTTHAWVLLLIVVSALGTACATTRTTGKGPNVPRPFPGAPAPPSTPEVPATAGAPSIATPPALVEPLPAVVTTALTLRGKPYRNGGNQPSDGFDCSGLVQWVFAQHGAVLPRDVRQQFEAGEKVDADELKPGDLVFFETVSRGPSHVGIAIGGGEFVHAPSSRGVVRIEKLSTSYWSKRWVGARRLGVDGAGRLSGVDGG